MRTASYDEAASVLKSWRYDVDAGKVKMTVQYNPHSKFHHVIDFIVVYGHVYAYVYPYVVVYNHII